MFTSRKIGSSLLIASLYFAATSTTNAAGPAMPKLVLPKTADVRLLDVSPAAGTLPVGLVLGVLQVNGERLHVGRGELHCTDVVAMDEAVEFFTQQIARAPTPFAYVSRARALMQQGADREAVRNCERALALDPNYAPAHCQLGRALTSLKHYNQALESLQRAATLDGKSGFIYCTRAQTHQAMGNSAAALADFDLAVEFDDQLVSAYFGRGSVRIELGDADRALHDFSNAITRHPTHYYALNSRANIWLQRGEWQSAYDDYSAALKLAERPELRMNRAEALRGLGRFAEAVADCNEAIRLAPHMEAAYRQRAALLVEVGKKNEAELDLNRADQLASDNNAA